MSDDAYLRELQKAIEAMHGLESEYLRSEPVTEMFGDKIAWQGEVEVFHLKNSPKAKRCYAWGYKPDDGKGGWQITTVLEIPPVGSPIDAVRVAIASKVRKQGRPS